MNIGFIHPEISFEDRVKRDFLFFDKLYVDKSALDLFYNFYEGMEDVIGKEKLGRTQSELNFLLENNLLEVTSIDESRKAIEESKNKTIENVGELLDLFGRQSYFKDIIEISRQIYLQKYNNAPTETEKMSVLIAKHLNISSIITRYSNLMMSYASPNHNYIPIINGILPSVGKERASDVIEITLANLPIPDETVSWEKLIDFKSDEDAQLKVKRLRKWMREISTKNLNPIELKEELDYLLHEYENHLKLHKMKYRISVFTAIIDFVISTTNALGQFEIISGASKGLLKFKKSKIDLLIGEAKAPGKEIAYLSRIKEKF